MNPDGLKRGKNLPAVRRCLGKLKTLVGYGIQGIRFRRNYERAYTTAIQQLYAHETLPSPEIRVLDVGARYGPQSRLAVLDSLGALRLTGIEPDSEEVARLSASYPNHRFHSVALGDSDGSQTLYLTKHRGWSSLYKPNTDLLDRFEFYDTEYDIEEKTEVETTTLDNLMTDLDEEYDLVKLDTQGSEGDIMVGGQKTLSESLAIEFETHFKPLYEEQMLFFDVHDILSDLRFELVTLDADANYAPWTKDGRTGGLEQVNPDGEVVEQNAFYIDFDLTNRIELIKSIIISLLYRNKSIAQHLTNKHDNLCQNDDIEAINSALDPIPSPT